MGYRVPGTDVLKLVRLFRAVEHRMTTAVVMVTDTDEVIEQSQAAGADDVLLKPVNPNALVWAVDEQVK